MKDLIGLEQLSASQIEAILETARPMKSLFTRSIKKVPVLRGKTVALLFFEPSTRTRSSFELAAKRLSADVINLAVNLSSHAKGESILDTVANLAAMLDNCARAIVVQALVGPPEMRATAHDMAHCCRGAAAEAREQIA